MKYYKYLEAGDIIVADRILYQHYGIYTGNGRVIHYSDKNRDFGADIKVRETSLKKFAKNGKFKIAIPAETGNGYEQFTPEETINRAKSRLGEKHYDLIFNNCEHFTSWCKTGDSKSSQVINVVSVVKLINTVLKN